MLSCIQYAYCVLMMLAVSSGKRNVTVWRPSVRLSVCPIFFLTLIEHAVHTQCDSPGGSTAYTENGHTYVAQVGVTESAND